MAVDLKSIIDISKEIFTIIAFIFGGLWTYFNFIKGRIYKPRLDISTSGVVDGYDQSHKVIIIKTSVTNVGSREVIIDTEKSGILFFSYPKSKYVKFTHLAVWDKPIAFSVFENHTVIESKETINDELLITLMESSDDILAWRIELNIVSKAKKNTIKWTSINIIINKKI